MRNALAIARKELSIYLTTPWAYFVFSAMLGVSAFYFLLLLQRFQDVQHDALMSGWARIPPEFKNLTDAVAIPLWGFIAFVTLVVSPFLSMRLFAEEKRQKTMELLMTAPVRPIEIVLGKFMGGVGIIWATLGLTIVFPLILGVFGASESGRALEWNTVLLGYGALLLWSATCVAVGMFLSSLTESQALAALLSIVFLLTWMLLGGVAQSSPEPWRSIAQYVSSSRQLEGMLNGVLELKALVFFGSVIFFALVLTHRSVESQRWT